MIKPRTFPLAVTIVASFWLAPSRASAQEVAWRHDYAAARKEAMETGRPLLLDFGYDGCVRCRKLDATTFRDPAAVRALNERFVPVKVDAQRDERVVRALGIESYPTLVLASAEGKVLGKHVGYAEVGQLMGLLGKAPASRPAVEAARPEVAGSPSPARTAYTEGRYAECLSLCRELTAGHVGAAGAAEAWLLIERMAADPVVRRRLEEQIAAGLDSLRPGLTAALER